MSELLNFRSWTSSCSSRGRVIPTILLTVALAFVGTLVASGFILFAQREPERVVPEAPGHVQIGEAISDVLQRYSGKIRRVAEEEGHTLLRIQNADCAYYVLVGPQAVEAVVMAPSMGGPNTQALAADYLAGRSNALAPQRDGQWLDPASGILLVTREDGLVVIANESGLQALNTFIGDL